MKRSAALAPLSRDHQHALDAALRLRRADAATIDTAIEHFRAFFESEGSRHFGIEEDLLVPALPADDSEWARVIHRMVTEHAAVREAVAESDRTSDRVSFAHSLGELLRSHVRFEERVLFELLERRLAADDLQRLGVAVAEAERARERPSS